jgi:nitrite reductase/ring-hydroxylating ferredoxin subunit
MTPRRPGRTTAHTVGALADFPKNTHRIITIDRREIGVFNVNGRLYGLPNICPHQTGPLCESKRTTGTLVSEASNDWHFEWKYDGEIVQCPWHGLEFNVLTGQCLALAHIKLRRYEILVEGDQVKVVL